MYYDRNEGSGWAHTARRIDAAECQVTAPAVRLNLGPGISLHDTTAGGTPAARVHAARGAASQSLIEGIRS